MFMFDTTHDQFVRLGGRLIDTRSAVLFSFEKAL